VQSFGDSRIRYYRTDRHLSMSGNWNYALQFIDGDYVMYLGDDDVLLPEAFSIAKKIFEAEDVLAIRRQGGYYFYPETNVPNNGWLSLPKVNGTYEIRDSYSELGKLIQFNYWYGHLPVLYHGFVSVPLLRDIQNRSNAPFFRKAAPDIYSDILLASQAIRYVYLYYPLTIGGAGSSSNGVQFKDDNAQEIKNDFIVTSIKEFPHNYSINLIATHVLDCLEDVIERFKIHDLHIDYYKAYHAILQETFARKMFCNDEIVKTIYTVGSKAGIAAIKISADISALQNTDAAEEHQEKPVARHACIEQKAHNSLSLSIKSAVKKVLQWNASEPAAEKQVREHVEVNLDVREFGVTNALEAADYLHSLVKHLPIVHVEIPAEQNPCSSRRRKIKKALKHIMQPPTFYSFLQKWYSTNWSQKKAQALEIAAWRLKGSPAPPPHIIKQQTILSYASRFNITLAVETGTFSGEMVAAIKDHFAVVYSIELSKELFKKARKRFHNAANVHLIQGDSARELGLLMKKINTPAIFWLDGHYSGGITAKGATDTPILKELEHILSSAHSGHVIIIDDARLFGTDPAYPTLHELNTFVYAFDDSLTITIKDDSIRITPNQKK